MLSSDECAPVGWWRGGEMSDIFRELRGVLFLLFCGGSFNWEWLGNETYAFCFLKMLRVILIWENVSLISVDCRRLWLQSRIMRMQYSWKQFFAVFEKNSCSKKCWCWNFKFQLKLWRSERAGIRFLPPNEFLCPDKVEFDNKEKISLLLNFFIFDTLNVYFVMKLQIFLIFLLQDYSKDQ